MENKARIKTECAFVILMQGMQPFVHNVFENTFLLINISSYTMQCGGQPLQSNCTFCLLDISAKCSFQAGNVFVPRISDYNFTGMSHTEPQYLVNLAVLIHLFDDDQLQTITGNSTFPTTPAITLPPFSFYTHTLSDAFVENPQVKLNLSKASEAVRQDQELLHHLGQAIITGRVEIPYRFFLTVPGILLQVISILVGLLVLNNLYITYKLKQTLLLCAVLQSQQKARN